MHLSIKKTLALATLSSGLLLSNQVYAHQHQAQENYLKEAQGLVKQFGGQLKPALKQAMKSGGPVAAVEVCKTKAPAIAAQIAKESGWNVTRVSLKPRGANATADAWETQVLKDFDAKKMAGNSPKTMQYSEVIKSGKGAQFRYMKAVGVEGVCLNCHGQKIAEPVKQALAKYYPNDTATGYQLGDIRGAFSFSKEMK